MRHQKTRRRLSRFGSHRKALLRNLVKSLLYEERISTTLARAKELRRLIDKLINLGKRQDLNSRRYAFKLLQDRYLVDLLFKDIALRFNQTGSGYTRIIRFKNRQGDNAQMVIVELTVQKPKKEKEIPKPKIKKEEIREEKKKVIPKEEIKEEEKEELPPPPPEKEKPKGFLEGLRGLFRRKKDQSRE